MNRIVQRLLTEGARQKLLPAGLTPHSLRHTFAKAYLARHPADLVGLARLLGHRSLETTRIYLEPTAMELAARVEALELNTYAQ
jgi:integrase